MPEDDETHPEALDELEAEHRRLLALARTLTSARARGTDEPPEWAELDGLLRRHFAKEEHGVFRQVRETAPIGDGIDAFCDEHANLLDALDRGFADPGTTEALKSLVVGVVGEERDLFPHVIQVLDRAQWDDVAAAHRAVDG